MLVEPTPRPSFKNCGPMLISLSVFSWMCLAATTKPRGHYTDTDTDANYKAQHELPVTSNGSFSIGARLSLR